jgi:HPt (histidine-containing phosphotransfer) domain-containing protein
MEAAVPPALAASLQTIWEKYLPRMEERLAVLEAAAAALEGNELTPEQCAAAAAAHKLAGVLGSFGLTRGTELAREAEILCGGEPEPDPVRAARLGEIAFELRAIVEARKREN